MYISYTTSMQLSMVGGSSFNHFLVTRFFLAANRIDSNFFSLMFNASNKILPKYKFSQFFFHLFNSFVFFVQSSIHLYFSSFVVSNCTLFSQSRPFLRAVSRQLLAASAVAPCFFLTLFLRAVYIAQSAQSNFCPPHFHISVRNFTHLFGGVS